MRSAPDHRHGLVPLFIRPIVRDGAHGPIPGVGQPEDPSKGEESTVPEDVGRVAAQAQVKTLVLSHFVPGNDPTITDEMWTEGVRKLYQGQIVVGRDLMEI